LEASVCRRLASGTDSVQMVGRASAECVVREGRDSDSDIVTS